MRSLIRISRYTNMTNFTSIHCGRRMLSTAASNADKSTIFWSGQVVFPNQVCEGAVEVNTSDGTILSCYPGQSKTEADQLAKRKFASFLDLGEKGCLSPGLFDVHVHISALGRDWEGYTSATQAAAAGGITTLIGMPLNSLPATTSPESFYLEKETAGNSDLYVDVGLWGGVVPGNCNSDALEDLLCSGVLGLKAFLSPLPPAAGYEAVSPKQLIQAAKICGQHDKPILVHSELMPEEELAQKLQLSFNMLGEHSYQAHLNSRPPEWEQRAVKVVCEAASYCHMHVVHLSDSGCLEMIRDAKNDQHKDLTVETCPHYLVLDSSIVQDADTRIKCFPPIRDPDNREVLWSAMESRLIDMVASDHSPCEPHMRCPETGSMKEAWGGLTGLQYQLQATWTEASRRGFSLLDMARWWSRNPSSLAGMSDIKGTIEPGKQADFCWWDPTFVGAPNAYSREYHRWTGDTYYASDSNQRGRVLGTWLRGEKVYDGESDQHLKVAGEFLEA